MTKRFQGFRDWWNRPKPLTMSESWALYDQQVKEAWDKYREAIDRINQAREHDGLGYDEGQQRWIEAIQDHHHLDPERRSEWVAEAQRNIMNFRLRQIRDLLRQGKTAEAADVLDTLVKPT